MSKQGYSRRVLYDVRCPSCGIVEIYASPDLPVCDKCGAEGKRVWINAPAVKTEQIWIRPQYDHSSGQWFDSPAQREQWGKDRGLTLVHCDSEEGRAGRDYLQEKAAEAAAMNGFASPEAMVAEGVYRSNHEGEIRAAREAGDKKH